MTAERRKSVKVIAEAGVNHNGDLDLAKRLVDAASKAGADFVKFQTFVAERVVTAAAGKAVYQKETTGPDGSQLRMLKQLELSQKMHEELINHCRDCGIQFLSTAFDHESLDYLNELGSPLFKIPSGEITNLPYLRHVGKFRKPVILSSGMATLDEVGEAVEVLEASGTLRAQVTVLHCNTDYPTPMRDVNLRAMWTIRDTYKVDVGYSDHTRGIEVPIAAVAMGASVIEKHLTLDSTMPGPDHAASCEPEEFVSMVQAIRNIESALGDGVKRPSQSEKENITVVRRSIIAARNISKGEVFDEENIVAKRPGNGISPMLWDQVLGQAAIRDFAADELIEL